MTLDATRQTMDPVDLVKSYADIVQHSAQLMGDFVKRQSTGGSAALGDDLGIAKAFVEMSSRLFADPARMAQMQVKLWQDYASLWQNTMLQFMGGPSRPVVEPGQGDRRFKHEAWQQNFLYDYIKQSYLIPAKHLHQTVGGVQGLDEHTEIGRAHV